jgi:hypothetical protein
MKIEIKQADDDLETMKAKCEQETTTMTTKSMENETATTNTEEEAHPVGEKTIK